MVLALGCAEKFTRDRFDMITTGVDDQEDVQRILGEPQQQTATQWYYEDLDDNVHARIFFDDAGRVRGKEWMDARTGEWDGRHPDAAEVPPGEVRERSTRTTTIDDD